MADTVSVTQALLMARSWLPHASDCAAVNPKPTGDGYDAQCTCGLTEKLQAIDSALASTQPAPASPRDEVDRLTGFAQMVADMRTIAPEAWEAKYPDVEARARRYAKVWGKVGAEDYVSALIDHANSLLQGKQP